MTDTDHETEHHETERHVEVDTSFCDFYRAELTGQVRRAALMVGSSELAHDLVHDVFVEMYPALEHDRRARAVSQPVGAQPVP